MREQHAVAFGLASAHTTPELVELGKAEPVRILHHHQRRIGYIYTHLDNRGCYQNIGIALGKFCHHHFLFSGLHLSVQKRYTQVGEHLLLQGFRPNLCGFQIQTFGFFYRRTHHIALMSLGHMLADKIVDSGSVAFIYQEGINLLSAGGQLVQYGHLQIPVH